MSILPHETNTVMGLFCHWQNTADRILDLKQDLEMELSVYRIWILKRNCLIGLGFEKPKSVHLCLLPPILLLIKEG